MTRRTAVLLFSAAPLALRAADSAADVWSVVAVMAAALAEDNPEGFIKALDPRMPGYDKLVAAARGIILQADVHSAITPIDNQGDDSARTLSVTWELRLTRKGDPTRMDVREEAVTLNFRRDGKRWLVTNVDPVSFFNPPDYR
jgi:hypothetical protein